MTDELYDALVLHLRRTDDVVHALFVDRDGVMRTDPSRTPPPGGQPAHMAAVRKVPRFRDFESPVMEALRAGVIRVRIVEFPDKTQLSLTIERPITRAQRERLDWMVSEARVSEVDGKYGGWPITSLDVIPLE